MDVDGGYVGTECDAARAEVLRHRYGNGLCPRLARLDADGNHIAIRIRIASRCAKPCRVE